MRLSIVARISLCLCGALLQPGEARAALIPGGRPVTGVRIRVRLAAGLPQVSLRGYDLRFYEIDGQSPDRVADRRLALAPGASSHWRIRCEGDRIRATNLDKGESLLMRAPIAVSSPAGLLMFRDRPYREELRIFIRGSLCEVINDLDIERYLNGLVNAEFNSKWNEESIAAQVVAARTYAYYQIRETRWKRKKRDFDVDAGVRDQVYDGFFGEDFRASRAVERTRGMILTASANDVEPIKAFYHSTCGGRTDLPQNVWGGQLPGFRHEVACPFCAHSPALNWQAELNANEVAELMLGGARLDGAQPGWPRDWRDILRNWKLLDLRAGRADETGRLLEVATLWGAGASFQELRVSAYRFREWMGSSRIKSTEFQIVPHDGWKGYAWHFYGRGSGHGVGMCQWGAKTMGERGYAMNRILKFYYPDAILKKLW